jgi:hypothetical protein
VWSPSIKDTQEGKETKKLEREKNYIRDAKRRCLHRFIYSVSIFIKETYLFIFTSNQEEWHRSHVQFSDKNREHRELYRIRLTYLPDLISLDVNGLPTSSSGVQDLISSNSLYIIANFGTLL